MSDDFFREQQDQSVVKTQILTKYFVAWSNVMISEAKRRSGRLGYIDLFCGQGRYEDGSESTPLMVLRRAIDHPDLREMLLTRFVDADEKKTARLAKEIEQIEGIESLKYPPEIVTAEITDEVIQKLFGGMRLVPSLLFVDPWGYRGLSRGVVRTIVSNWGCDAVFFFNYNRINPALNNPLVRDHVSAIFGDDRADRLDHELEGLSPQERESRILEALTQAMKEMGTPFVLPFCFKNAAGSRTSHYLIFVTKHPLGYKIMKHIMAGESTSKSQNVASFAYCEADISCPLLFDLSRPLDDLEDMLLQEYAGRKLTVNEVFEAHNVGRPYTESNYKSVLRQMHSDGKIQCTRQKPWRSGSMPGDVMVIFPER